MSIQVRPEKLGVKGRFLWVMGKSWLLWVAALVITASVNIYDIRGLG